MKTTQKDLSKTRVEITVTLGPDELSSASDKALAHLARELKISGFRKGKVPLELAKKHIPENDIASLALDIAVRTAIPKIFDGLMVVSMPEVSVDKYVPGQTVEFRATADILPEVKLGNFKNLKVKKPETKLEPKSVDEVLSNIANSFAEKKVVSRAAKLTDEVQIDFTGFQKGKPFDGGAAKDFKLILGSNQLIPGFEKGIIGHSSGDKFELPLTFPKNYHNDQLAGKKVTFEILLKQVNEVVAPKIDDDLAQKAGPFKTLKELKADIEKNLKVQSEHSATEQYKDALVAELVKLSTVFAPEPLIADQLRIIKHDIERNLSTHNVTEEEYLKQSNKTKQDWEKDATTAAETRVKSALVLQALAKELNLSATETEVDAKITELREVYKNNPEAMKNLSDPRLAADVKNRLTFEKALEALITLNSK